MLTMKPLTAKDIVDKFINFYENRGHKRIENASLVPQNDPTTLFTSSGMQPLVTYLLGEPHPQGNRLVNVQNSFRAQDIEEVGDNRHTTFFRMLGNWSLGSYFKAEQLPWVFEFLTDEEKGLSLDPEKLYVSVFKGYNDIPYDSESEDIWKELFESKNVDPQDRIFAYNAEKNWWSRAGVPENMPPGEPGGPDSEVFYDFGDEKIHNNSAYKNEKCHINCDCGRYLEIGNSVFMQYKKTENSFEELPQKNVDFGGGLERLLAARQDQPDVFKTTLFSPIISSIENVTNTPYEKKTEQMRIITDHLVASMFIISSSVKPSNTEQGYILRRLLRRAFDNFSELNGKDVTRVLHTIAEQYGTTDPDIKDQFEKIKLTVVEEKQAYEEAISRAHRFIQKKYKEKLPSGKEEGGEIMGVKEISADDAFTLYSTHGLSPSQIKSLGYTFNGQKFADLMKEHKDISRKGAEQKFKGGLADQSENTLRGHTATHLLHKALRDMFGDAVKQAGSNITGERVRFDFTFDRKLTDEELKEVEDKVNQKIKEDLPVYFKILPKDKAEKLGALSFFGEKYGDEVKVYFIGAEDQPEKAYSKEFCGGPHVNNTKDIVSFKIQKEKSAAKGVRRIYAQVGV